MAVRAMYRRVQGAEPHNIVSSQWHRDIGRHYRSSDIESVVSSRCPLGNVEDVAPVPHIQSTRPLA